MSESAEPAGDTLSPGAAALQAIMVSNPAAAAVVGAVSGTSSAVSSAASSAASAVSSVVTDHLANWALIGIGVVLAVGALMISQKGPTTQILESATGAIRTAGAVA